MSTKLNGAYPTRNTTGLANRTLPGGFTPVTTPWVRNPSWPACEAPSGSNKFVGLYAVYPGDGVGNGGNFFAVTVSGGYTIDYGDGTVTNYTTGSTAYYEFNYNNAALAGTNAPVTLTAASSTVNRTAHGYTDGMTVRLYNIVTTTGLSEDSPYYVVNATADTFQVSATAGGAPVAFTNDGTATLLPYKIAVVTITPQAGQQITSLNLFVRHNTTNLQAYTTGWLDIAVAYPDLTLLVIGAPSSSTVRHTVLERAQINQTGAVTSFNYLFGHCYSLRTVVINAATANVTNMSSMFNGCYSLTTVPLFNTAAVTNMSNMFANCYSLTTVPLFDTAAVTAMNNMFQYCYSLTSVPLFNTAAVTNMSSMFQNCYLLTSVPMFNTAAVTNMSGMFVGCYSLTSVPAFTVTAVSSSAGFSSFVSGCTSLARIRAKDFRFTFSVANCKLSSAALDEIYTNLPTVTGKTITVTGNYGTATDTPSIATAKGWTVSG